jgi:hypothetical protein
VVTLCAALGMCARARGTSLAGCPVCPRALPVRAGGAECASAARVIRMLAPGGCMRACGVSLCSCAGGGARLRASRAERRSSRRKERISGAETRMQARAGRVLQRSTAGQVAAGGAVAVPGVQKHILGRITWQAAEDCCHVLAYGSERRLASSRCGLLQVGGRCALRERPVSRLLFAPWLKA